MDDLATYGATDIKEGFKAVRYRADQATAYSIHLKLGTASRILKIYREGAALSRKALFFQATKIKWDLLLDQNKTYLVEGVAGDRGPNAPSSNEISKAIREAIEACHKKRQLQPPKVDLKDPHHVIVGFYYGGKICISIDTSGKSLHKRGYKVGTHPAPIKEHLAHGLLKLAGYDGSQPIMDPMCGSGTFAIEAAYIALTKAPLIHRKKGDFGLEHLKNFDRTLWRETQDEARQMRGGELPQPIYAFDISPEYVNMTKKHALRARVERHLEIDRRDFLSAPPPPTKGLLICNLPYGDRLSQSDGQDLAAFYKAFGDTLKKQYTGWRAAILTAENAPWQSIGLRASKRLKIQNGGINCKFLIYDLYEGSHKRSKRARSSELPQDLISQNTASDGHI